MGGERKNQQTDPRRRGLTPRFQSNCFEEITGTVLWERVDGSFASFVAVLESSFDGSDVLCGVIYWWNTCVSIFGCICIQEHKVYIETQNCTEKGNSYCSRG